MPQARAVPCHSCWGVLWGWANGTELAKVFHLLTDEFYVAGAGKPCPHQGNAQTYPTDASVPQYQAYSRVSVQ
jgi:hypothetical protein